MDGVRLIEVTVPHPRNIEELCVAKGMRMTEQRRIVARVLAAADDHPDVEELYRRCVKVDDRISISTVYHTVKLFEDSGIIERHDFREGRARARSRAGCRRRSPRRRARRRRR
jgi:Fur family ferric uptake transcriptional regulator